VNPLGLSSEGNGPYSWGTGVKMAIAHLFERYAVYDERPAFVGELSERQNVDAWTHDVELQAPECVGDARTARNDCSRTDSTPHQHHTEPAVPP